MKKLVLLLSVMFLVGSVAFAQSEKTGQPEKGKTMTINKDAKPAGKDVKPASQNIKPNPQNKLKKESGKPIQPVSGKTEKPQPKDKSVSTETTTTPVNPNGPEITFKETNHDFGTIPFKGNGSYEFEFVNTGKEPLILTQPKSSCGCTVPEWPRQPILPGESNVVKVTYKNTDRPGNFNKYVTVFSNAVVNKEVKLHIKGTVEAEPTDATPLKNDQVGSPVKNN